MTVNAPPFRAFFGMSPGQDLWFGIQPLSAAVFGVPAGLLATAVVSMASRPIRVAPPLAAGGPGTSPHS
jgi:cation/acetate symporter